MVQLSVRDVPIEIVEELRREAVEHHTSINSVARLALEQHARQRRRQRELDSVLPAIEDLHRRILERREGWPLEDSAELISQDRAR